jgi:ATP-dependent Lon protease
MMAYNTSVEGALKAEGALREVSAAWGSLAEGLAAVHASQAVVKNQFLEAANWAREVQATAAAQVKDAEEAAVRRETAMAESRHLREEKLQKELADLRRQLELEKKGRADAERWARAAVSEKELAERLLQEKDDELKRESILPLPFSALTSFFSWLTFSCFLLCRDGEGAAGRGARARGEGG